MEEKIIRDFRSSIPALFMLMKNQKKSNLVVDYDREADVLYVSFDGKKKAEDTEFYSDDILIRKKNKKTIGITVLHASSFLS